MVRDTNVDILGQITSGTDQNWGTYSAAQRPTDNANFVDVTPIITSTTIIAGQTVPNFVDDEYRFDVDTSQGPFYYEGLYVECTVPMAGETGYTTTKGG